MNEINAEMSIAEVAALVCQNLKDNGIDVVLTGGAVVSIYSDNEYQSWDLDFVKLSDSKKIHDVMENLGFRRENGRHYIHPRTKIFVEFPGSVLAIGNQSIRKWSEKKTKYGILYLLAPTECVMDRLAAFYHWNDKQGLEQAVMVARRHPVKLEAIRKWSQKEGMINKFKIFYDELSKRD